MKGLSWSVKNKGKTDVSWSEKSHRIFKLYLKVSEIQGVLLLVSYEVLEVDSLLLTVYHLEKFLLTKELISVALLPWMVSENGFVISYTVRVR